MHREQLLMLVIKLPKQHDKRPAACGNRDCCEGRHPAFLPTRMSVKTCSKQRLVQNTVS